MTKSDPRQCTEDFTAWPGGDVEQELAFRAEALETMTTAQVALIGSIGRAGKGTAGYGYMLYGPEHRVMKTLDRLGVAVRNPKNPMYANLTDRGRAIESQLFAGRVANG